MPMVMTDRHGRDSLVVAIKATFTISPKIRIADEQVPLTLADEFYADPVNSSIKYPSDIYLPKPGFDVVFRGSAYAPGEQPVPALMAQLIFQNSQLQMRVSGDRVWSNGRPTAPQPFLSMPLLYESAYGGVHHFKSQEPMGPKSCVYVPENPVGQGFAGKRKEKEVEGLPVPNLENPQQLLHLFGDKSTPICWGAIAPSWVARSRYAGTYDEQWQQSIAPALPQNFDERFFHVGSSGLSFPQAKIQGGESVRLINLAPESDIAFNVPACPLDVSVSLMGGVHSVPVDVETLLIEPDENRFCLTWKGVFPCERKATLVEGVNVNFARYNG